jgi:hypothetical protein
MIIIFLKGLENFYMFFVFGVLTSLIMKGLNNQIDHSVPVIIF